MAAALAAGRCSLIATQAGDATWYAAPSVVQSVVIMRTVLEIPVLEMPVRVYAPVIRKG